MKQKSTAGILGILLGGLGAHKFYLGKVGVGVIYLILCWTFIPMLVGLIEGIVYLTMTDGDFNKKYNGVQIVNVQDEEAKKEALEKKIKLEEKLKDTQNKMATLVEENKIRLKKEFEEGKITKEIFNAEYKMWLDREKEN